MITGKELINEYQKMYSENEEIQEEKLYSTGDNYLDDLLERAFCEGYEYAQREFGNKENKIANKKAMAKIIAETKLDEEGHTGKNLLFKDFQYMFGSKKSGNNKDILPGIEHGSMMRVVRGNSIHGRGALGDKIGKFMEPSKYQPVTTKNIDETITKRGLADYSKDNPIGRLIDSSHRDKWDKKHRTYFEQLEERRRRIKKSK